MTKTRAMQSPHDRMTRPHLFTSEDERLTRAWRRDQWRKLFDIILFFCAYALLPCLIGYLAFLAIQTARGLQ